MDEGQTSLEDTEALGPFFGKAESMARDGE